MIVMDRNTKDLVIPKSLGNFGGGSEGGGGVTPEEVEQIASAITENAIDEYDTELQVDLEDMKEAISGNTQSIEELSGLTDDVAAISAATSANTEAVEALSGVPADIESLSSQTDYLSSRMESLIPAVSGLSGQTSANTEAIEVISAQTSANTANIETLSALTNAVAASGDVVYDYDEISGLTIDEKQAIWLTINREYKSKKVWIRKKRVYMGQILDVQWFLCYHSDTPFEYFVAVDKDKIYTLTFNYNGGTLSVTENKIHPVATDSTLGEIKVGSGLTIDSGGTISVEGGGGGAPSYIINDVLTGTTQDIIDFYNLMLPMVSGSSFEGINLYYRSRALNMTDNLSVCTNAWYQSAQDFGIDSLTFVFESYSYAILAGGIPDQYYITINSDGTTDYRYGAGGMPIKSADELQYRQFNVTSSGDMVNTYAGWLAGTELWHCWVVDSETYAPLAPIAWVNRYKTQYPYTVYQFGADVPINGTMYKGIWSVRDDNWETIYTTSWTSGSTIPVDSHFPPAQ